MKKFLLPVLLILPFAIAEEVIAQDLLLLDQAIEIGLENNFGIQIISNNAQIAANNRTLGNAGFLPSISLDGSRSESVEDSRFQTGDTDGVVENLGARSTNTNAGVFLNWTLFDGMQMFINYDTLGELEELGAKEFRFQAENLIGQIIDSYVSVTRIHEQLRVLENSVEVTEERIQIAETMRDLGSGSEYDLLQARTDLNADRAAVLRERRVLKDAKISLNEILALDPDFDFEVTEDIPVNRDLAYEYLYANMLENNVSLQLAQIEQRIAGLEMREIRSERFPEIELSSGYDFNRTEGGGSFFQFNETSGFRIGITARVNIFDGFDTNRRIQNARINLKNSELLLEEEKNRIDASFKRAFENYINSLELVDLEESNLDIAEETLDIALERFRTGTISAIEFREAQRAFLSAESRLIDAKYEAKVAETELLRLSGELGEIAL